MNEKTLSFHRKKRARAFCTRRGSIHSQRRRRLPDGHDLADGAAAIEHREPLAAASALQDLRKLLLQGLRAHRRHVELEISSVEALIKARQDEGAAGGPSAIE